MKVSIIIPAYNEEKRIGKTLEEYGKFFQQKLKQKKLKDFRIIVVINNTTDRTEEIVKGWKKKFKQIEYLNFKEGGKGFAIIEGFKYALKKGDELIGFVDADMATSPESFYDLIENVGDYDGIIASRYIGGAVVNPRQSWQRVFVSRIFNTMIRSLFFIKYRDTQCGAKLFKREVVEIVLPEIGITQWAFDVDLLYQLERKNKKIKEFPTVWADKEYSKINFMKAGPRMGLAIIRLRLIYSPFEKLLVPVKFIAGWGDRLINRK